jgi:hypothetical protein
MVVVDAANATIGRARSAREMTVAASHALLPSRVVRGLWQVAL